MKVKTIILVFIALLVTVGCNKSKTFKVTLNFDNADGQIVYLCKSIDANTDAVIDSAVISGKTAELTAGFTNESVYRQNVQKFIESGGQSTKRV